MEVSSRQRLAVLTLVTLGFISIGSSIWYKKNQTDDAASPVKIIDPISSPSRGYEDMPQFGRQITGTPESEPASTSTTLPVQTKMVLVHVAGQVNKPGVYKLSPGSRVIDAVKAAGGVKPDADQDAINLAAKLTDGEQILLYKKGAVPASPAVSPSASPALTSASKSLSRTTRIGHSAPTRPGPTIVNINRAGLQELDRLPGVGPATAKKILEYRKAAGGFARPEELLNVRGIGEKKFADMKPYVVVN